MKKVILVDIDNCYADSRDWIAELPELSSKDRNAWDLFLRKIGMCKPNRKFIERMLNFVSENDCYPVFITSRECRFHNYNNTMEQIEDFSNGRLVVNKNCVLFMRNNCDFRNSFSVKKDILENILNIIDVNNILFAVDDTYDNCVMFKNYGIKSIMYDIVTDTYKEI